MLNTKRYSKLKTIIKTMSHSTQPLANITKKRSYTMTKTILALAVASGLSLTAHAQQNIRVNQAYNGELSEASDYDSYESKFYNQFELSGRSGKYVQIDMVSNEIDSQLVASDNPEEFNIYACDDCSISEDDDGGIGYNSRLIYQIPREGKIYIQARSYENQLGPYSIQSKYLPNPSVPDVENISRNTPLIGFFDSQSSLNNEGYYYDLYRIRGNPGEVVRVKIESDDVEISLDYGSIEDGEFVSLAFDESQRINSRNDSNKRLTFKLDNRGRALIKVSSENKLDIGEYQISYDVINAVTDIKPMYEIGANQIVQSKLTEQDPLYRGDFYMHSYKINGLPGQRYSVTTSTSELDTQLLWGRMVDGEFVIDLKNDDADEDMMEDAYSENEYDEFAEAMAVEEGGLDSELSIILDRSGQQVLIVTSYESEATGDYSLKVMEE